MTSRPAFFWMMVLGVTGLLGSRLSSIIGPFILGWLLAYALNPLASLFQRWKFSRFWAVMTILVLLLGFVMVLLHVTIPILAREFVILSHHLPATVARVSDTLWKEWTQSTGLWAHQDLGQLVHDSMGSIVQGVSGVISHVFSGGQTLVSALWVLFLTPLSTFYFLKDWSSVLNTLQRWLPRSYEPMICHYARQVHYSLARFIRGQVSVCLLSALGHIVGLELLQLEGAFLLGIISGLLAFIPYGALCLGMPVALMLVAFQMGTLQSFVLVAAVFMVMHAIEANVLVPKLVGSEIGMHPLWMIFIFLASADLFGFWGVLLALPLAACLKVLAQMFLDLYKHSSYYRETPGTPFPEENSAR